MDPDTFQRMQQQTSIAPSPDQSTLSQIPQAPQSSQPQDNENWFQKLLPTIGSVGLPLLGAALAPETGGLSLLASTALAGAGGALGKGAEDLSAGKDLNAGDLLSSGAESAGGNLLGAGIGKAIGGIGGVISNVGEKGLANEAAANAASDAVSGATATKLNYGGISPKLQGDLNLGSNQKLVGEAGFDPTNPYDMQKVSQAGHVLNGVYNEALSQTEPVDMKGFGNIVYDTLQKTGSTDLTASPLGKAIAAFQAGGENGARQITDTMAPTDVRSLQQAVGTQIGNTQRLVNNAEINGLSNTEAESQLSALHSIYDQLGGKIKTPELNDAIKNATVSDADRASLIAQHGDTLGNQIADTINNAGSADDLLKPMQNFTQMGHASDMAINDIENATGTARAVERAKFAANGGLVTPSSVQATNEAPTAGDVVSGLNHPVAKLTGAALNIGAKGGAGGKAAVNLGSTLSRIAPFTGSVAGETIANAPNLTPNTAPGSFQTNPMQQPQQTPTQTALQLALNGSANPYEAGSYTPILNQLTQEAQQAHSGQAALQSLEQAYQGAGGGQGLVGGLLAKLGGGLTGNNVSAYDQQRQQAMQVLSKLGIPVSALPDVTSTNPAAASQFSNIQNILSSIGQ